MPNWFHALACRWHARRFRRAPRLPAILLYHSVGHRARDPLRLTISPALFATHLTWLTRFATPLPLLEFVRRQQDGSLPANAVAVTFDDGYADNVATAEPLLQSSSIPATIFVATDYIDSADEGWWDELDALFLATPRLPRKFRFEDFTCEVESYLDNSRAPWTVLTLPGSLRECAFLGASAFARRVSRKRRREFLRALRTWAGRPSIIRDGCGFSRWTDLRAATQRGLLTIGAHTCSHPALAALPHAEQRAEIEGSQSTVKEQLGVEPAGFAYPFGTHHDFSPSTRRLVATSGLRFACANLPGHINRNTSRWQLPRLLVRDWAVPELAARLGL